VKVATLNLRADANGWHERLPLVVDVLSQTDADVIALQEIRLRIDQHEQVANSINHGSMYTPYLCEDWYEPCILGNALLSRLPIIQHERIELEHGFRTAQRILLDVNGQQMGDMNADPDSETIRTAKQHLHSAYEAIHGCEPEATFPTPLRESEALTPRTIDYIFCSPSLAVVDAALIADTAHPDNRLLYPSDHYGLYSEIITP
jgi:endonuclease/exonuclease/phosphatase family metal-dependent hydrolase